MKRATSTPQHIPDKIYFRIGEVSDLVGVDPHVLRYWEPEFAMIKPFRGKSKQRLYRRQDVEHLLLIKTLLHDEGYTISGAKKLLKNTRRHAGTDNLGDTDGDKTTLLGAPLLDDIKSELRDILEQLGRQKPVGHK